MTAPLAARLVPAGERWRSLRPGARRLLLVGAAILGVNVALAGLEAVTGGAGPGGPPSSSFATAPDGLAAFADLLRDSGHPVRRFRTSLDRADLDADSTLVVADVTALDPGELDAVVRFVESGGRLVATGPGAATVADRLLGNGPNWSPRGATPARPLVPTGEVAGINSVVAAGVGSWEDAGVMLPVLAGSRGVLATVASLGRGRVVAVADSSPWQNRMLARADNAAFGLAVVGPPERPVGFAEAAHGYGTGRGLGALPYRWRWALAGAVVTVLVWMWSRGRRFGPPEDGERLLPPSRRAYVDAVAATLVRTRRPAESMAPLQAAARRRLERAGGLPAGAGAAELRPVATRVGLAPEDLATIVEPVRRDDEVMAAAAVLARLEGPGK